MADHGKDEPKGDEVVHGREGTPNLTRHIQSPPVGPASNPLSQCPYLETSAISGFGHMSVA